MFAAARHLLAYCYSHNSRSAVTDRKWTTEQMQERQLRYGLYGTVTGGGYGLPAPRSVQEKSGVVNAAAAASAHAL